MRAFKHSAFTLIELLIVMAIISLLAAIMFPTFARARENARRTSCSSNMRQIGLGITQYTQDYDDFLPLRMQTTPTSTNWQNMIQPYVKNYQMFQCPSNEKNRDALNDDASRKSFASYAPNVKVTISGVDNGGLFGKMDSGAADAVPVSLSQVTSPTTTIAFCEANGTASDFIMTSGHFATMSNCGDKPCLATRHLGTGNFLFADGHVKALRPESTISPINMWNRFDNTAFSGTPSSTSKLIVQQSTYYATR